MIDQDATAAVSQGAELVSSQLASGALLAYALQWAKNSKLVPFITEHTVGVNRTLTGLMAFIAAIGIHYTFDADAGVLVIGGLHTQSLLHGFWAWISQWAFQQGASDMIFTKTTAEAVKAGDVPRPTGLVEPKP